MAVDIGSALEGATQLMQYVIGMNTQTNTSGTSSSSSSLNATTQASSNTLTTTNQDVNTASNSSTNTSQTTTSQNTTDPGVVASMKALAQQAITNSTNPAATTGLMTSFIQNATDAMTAVFGTAKQAGVYNSSAANVQNNDILSRATADAAQAVLNYQTSEQGIADTTLNQLGQLLSGNTTTTDTASNTSSDVNQQTTGAVDVQDTATTTVNEQGSNTAQQQSTSSTHSGMSLICTWMVENSASPTISFREYALIDVAFRQMSDIRKSSYMYWSWPIVRYLRATKGRSWFGRLIIWLFTHRTKYVIACRWKREGYKKTWCGRLATGVVATITFFAGISLLARYTRHNYRLIRNYRRKVGELANG